jgi:hypothetical protein
MSTEPGITRWWENYLPRYLMPSIAGAIIVNWLCHYGGDGLRSILSLPIGGKPIDAASLVLLFLYGNLFCYIASYPVLVFHATRVMDFAKGKWPARPLLDGYLATLGLLLSVFLFIYATPETRYWLAFIFTAIITFIQIGRLWIVLSNRFTPKDHGDVVSSAYFYSYILAHRRGIPAVQTGSTSNSAGTAQNLFDDEEKHNLPYETEEAAEITTTKNQTNLWRKEFIDTYRHLREHGNSAFIFILEIALATLTYCVIAKPEQLKPEELPSHKLGEIGVLFAIWATPSIFVHLLSQHLERRFSRYDQRIK